MKWVSVKKQLPPFGQDVLVYLTNDVSPTPFIDLMYRCESDNGYWDWYFTYNKNLALKSHISHWTTFTAPKDNE